MSGECPHYSRLDQANGLVCTECPPPPHPPRRAETAEARTGLVQVQIRHRARARRLQGFLRFIAPWVIVITSVTALGLVSGAVYPLS